MKIKIPPIPGMIPCEIKSVKIPAGSSSAAKVLKEAKVLSMKSIGTDDQSKMDWNITKRITKKMMYPQNLWVKTRSNLERKSLAMLESTVKPSFRTSLINW